jgi:hypothetical protein
MENSMNIKSRILPAIVGFPLILGIFANISTAQAQPNTPGDTAPAQSESIGAKHITKKAPFTKVAVLATPKPGQNQRFSENFNLKGVKSFKVKVFQNGKLNNRISFNVKKDRRGPGLDPIVLSGVKTGSYVYQGPSDSLYVANPQGAGKAPFIVISKL